MQNKFSYVSQFTVQIGTGVLYKKQEKVSPLHNGIQECAFMTMFVDTNPILVRRIFFRMAILILQLLHQQII
jgi:hypothetical protein